MTTQTKHKEDLDELFGGEEAQSVTFYAAGVQFRKGWRKALAALEEGEELFLVPEPTNKFDENAVQLCSGNGIFLGYVPAKGGLVAKNLWVLKAFEEGKLLRATVVATNPDADPWNALLVEVGPLKA